jgi:organic hydroperoxide reductase OsmC/OhrA
VSATEASPRKHEYRAELRWTGNRGTGTQDYRAYGRDHTISCEGKPSILGSSDPAFRGDPDRYNPEELLVASLSACHMLWYLHLCATAGVRVEEYTDAAEGVMELATDGSGHFTRVTLRPIVTIGAGSRRRAEELHESAHRMCFLANSMNFPVVTEATIRVR